MAKQALILYYSQFGNTARLASKIHEATGADIVRIKVPDDAFPLDMEETGKIYQQQLKMHALPKLVTTLPDLLYYDLILVGGPVWNGKVASPIIALLQQLQEFTGKIAPFSTVEFTSFFPGLVYIIGILPGKFRISLKNVWIYKKFVLSPLRKSCHTRDRKQSRRLN